MDNNLKAVLAQYGLEGTKTALISDKEKKPVWRLRAGGREFILKRMPMDEGRLRFVIAASRHLAERGVRVPLPVPTRRRADYAALDGRFYCLTEVWQGRRMDYGKDLERIVAALARFHLGSRGFQGPPKAQAHTLLGSWPDHCRKKLGEFERFADQARRGAKSSFAVLFLEHLPWFRGEVEAVLSELEHGGYRAWVQKVEAEGCLCHQDFAAGNLLLGAKGEVLIFDLDAVAHDLPARDLRKILNKVMKERGWDAALARRILDWYTAVHPLEREERSVLALDVRFPHLFCGMVNKYFTGRTEGRSDAEMAARLRHTIQVERGKAKALQALTA